MNEEAARKRKEREAMLETAIKNGFERGDLTPEVAEFLRADFKTTEDAWEVAQEALKRAGIDFGNWIPREEPDQAEGA